jgi:hypothetical protein
MGDLQIKGYVSQVPAFLNPVLHCLWSLSVSVRTVLCVRYFEWAVHRHLILLTDSAILYRIDKYFKYLDLLLHTSFYKGDMKVFDLSFGMLSN